MLDFFANWFGSKTVNEKGETLKATSHFKNGHFSLDLTFLVIVVCIILLILAVVYIKRRMDKRYKKRMNVLIDVEMQRLKGCAPAYSEIQTQTGRI
jgi:hypothetical protein